MNAHGIVRICVLTWACGLITWAVHYVLVHTPQVGGDAAGVLTAIIGILAVAVGLYEWRQSSASTSNGAGS